MKDENNRAQLTEMRPKTAELASLAAKLEEVESAREQLSIIERQQRKLIEALRQNGTALSDSLNSSEVFDQLLKQINSVMPCDLVYLMLVEDNTVWLRHSYGRLNVDDVFLTPGFDLNHAPTLRKIQETGQPLIISLDNQRPAESSELGRTCLKSWATAPIRLQNQIAGFLSLGSITPDFFSQADLEYLQIFADQAAIAVKNARLQDQARHEVVKRIQALKKERNFVSTVLNTAGALILVLDPQARIIRFNRACEQTTQYSFAEVQDKPFWNFFVTPEELDSVKAVFQALRAGQFPNEYESHWVTKQGERRLIAWSNTVLLNAIGAVEYIISIGIDITERKRAEEALRESEARIRAIVNSAADGIITIDEEGLVKSFNPAAAQIFGYNPAEIIGQHIMKLLPDPDQAEFDQYAIHYLKNLNESKIADIGREVIGQRKEGATFPMHLALSEVYLGNRQLFIGIVRDITERRRLEDRLVAIHQLGRELNLLRDETTILERVMETAVNVLWCEAAGYGLANRTSGELEYHYYPVRGEPEVIKLHLRLDQEEELIAAIKQNRRATTRNHSLPIPGNPPPPAEAADRAWLSAPMKIGHRIVGILNAESRDPNQFTPNDQQLLQTLADQTAVALENARLYDETRQRVEELAVLNMIGQAITSTLNLPETLTIITDHAIRLLDVMGASVVLHDQTKGDLWVDASSGAGSNAVRGKRLAIGQGVVGWVIQHGEPVLVPDVSQDPRFFDGFDRQYNFKTHSILSVPLQTGQQTIGAIEVINKKSGPFDQKDLRLLSWLAMPAATAIENARLFKAEHSAREQAETLREATSTLTSTLELNQVLDRILIHLEQVVPYDSACVSLWEGEWLRVVAGRGLLLAQEQIVGHQYPANNPLYQEIRNTGHPLILANASTDPRFQPWDGVDDVGGWMGVPLMVQSEVIGYLTLDSQEVGVYSQVEAALAQAFANQAAVAIQNAQLFEQVRIGHERLQSLSHRLVEIQETERRHIARELHDEAGQALTSMMVGLHLLEREIDRPAALVTRIAELKRMADGVLENLHRLAMDLRPASLDHLGLVAALRQHIENFSQQHDLVTQFEAAGLDDERLPPPVETNLYRIVQEALTNIARHAQATHADVLLERRNGQVITIVEDNGVGFEVDKVPQSNRLGLLGIRERAEMLGGTLVVESTPGTGTTIFVEVPYVY